MEETKQKQFNPNDKQYCNRCGAVLKVETYAQYFKTDTGEDYYHYKFTCPKWKPWTFYKHAKFRCDQNGSTYAYEA